MEFIKEFERQEENLIEKGYPEILGVSISDFHKMAAKLKDNIKDIPVKGNDTSKGYLDFVIVIKDRLNSVEAEMSKVVREGKSGLVKLDPLTTKDFTDIESEKLPFSPLYLLYGIDRGSKFLNVRPGEALSDIKKSGLHPLTISEGVAIVTHFPEFLERNNCFSLLASRHVGDKRVPAIWLNAKNEPNLGWCWEGNPHTWLGSAFAKDRIGSNS